MALPYIAVTSAGHWEGGGGGPAPPIILKDCKNLVPNNTNLKLKSKLKSKPYTKQYNNICFCTKHVTTYAFYTFFFTDIRGVNFLQQALL
jgi:hypothetical protein